MKYYKNCEILKIKGNRINQWLYKRRSFNKLYNDYKIRNLKKDNIKINHFSSQSELYPFTPLINKSGYISFSPRKDGIYSPNTSRYSSFQKNRMNNQNRPSLFEYSSFGRNITDGNLYNDKIPIKINDYNYYDKNDNIIYGRQNDYFNNIKYKKSNRPNRNNLNRTDYRFFTPNHRNKNGIRNKNIYSNTDDDINSQIFQYLNNFNKNNRNLSNNSKKNKINYLNTTPRSRTRSNIELNLGNKFDIDGHKISPLINNIKSPYNSNVDNYFNKNGKKINNLKINERLNKNNKLKNKYDIKYSNLKDKKEKNNKSKKNSNASLNPSSVGKKTYYTNKPVTTNNNIGTGATSNINSASSRKFDTKHHFLKGLRMTSGEVNEYFYDFNKKDYKDNNDDQKTTQSLQSLSDSKMLELANYYIKEEDDSTENYQMNNVVYNKTKHNIK